MGVRQSQENAALEVWLSGHSHHVKAHCECNQAPIYKAPEISRWVYRVCSVCTSARPHSSAFSYGWVLHRFHVLFALPWASSAVSEQKVTASGCVQVVA